MVSSFFEPFKNKSLATNTTSVKEAFVVVIARLTLPALLQASKLWCKTSFLYSVELGLRG